MNSIIESTTSPLFAAIPCSAASVDMLNSLPKLDANEPFNVDEVLNLYLNQSKQSGPSPCQPKQGLHDAAVLLHRLHETKIKQKNKLAYLYLINHYRQLKEDVRNLEHEGEVLADEVLKSD